MDKNFFQGEVKFKLYLNEEPGELSGIALGCGLDDRRV
jgi:hypothetical protein